MKCPFCGYQESRVIDSRPADEGNSIRRRRECLACGKRFTTFETVETRPLVVVKKDGRRQAFDRQKLLRGILRACEKRAIPLDALEQIVARIEQDLQNSMEREIRTQTIGEKVMEYLRALDQVAYVRFASVYRQFRDIDTFADELNKLRADKPPKIPSDTPSNEPSNALSNEPSNATSDTLSDKPSGTPSGESSDKPSDTPSGESSGTPSDKSTTEKYCDAANVTVQAPHDRQM